MLLLVLFDKYNITIPADKYKYTFSSSSSPPPPPPQSPPPPPPHSLCSHENEAQTGVRYNLDNHYYCNQQLFQCSSVLHIHKVLSIKYCLVGYI